MSDIATHDARQPPRLGWFLLGLLTALVTLGAASVLTLRSGTISMAIPDELVAHQARHQGEDVSAGAPVTRA